MIVFSIAEYKHPNPIAIRYTNEIQILHRF